MSNYFIVDITERTLVSTVIAKIEKLPLSQAIRCDYQLGDHVYTIKFNSWTTSLELYARLITWMEKCQIENM